MPRFDDEVIRGIAETDDDKLGDIDAEEMEVARTSAFGVRAADTGRSIPPQRCDGLVHLGIEEPPCKCSEIWCFRFDLSPSGHGLRLHIRIGSYASMISTELMNTGTIGCSARAGSLPPNVSC